jgi:hypothetical protein
MFHAPGTRKLINESDNEQLTRTTYETPININIRDIKYGLSDTYVSKRGTEFADVRYVFVENKTIDFYDVDNLPENTIEHHRYFIKRIMTLLRGTND